MYFGVELYESGHFRTETVEADSVDEAQERAEAWANRHSKHNIAEPAWSDLTDPGWDSLPLWVKQLPNNGILRLEQKHD